MARAILAASISISTLALLSLLAEIENMSDEQARELLAKEQAGQA